jgi:3-oxoacyl-[acyl-carrier-protein] synthase III
MKYGAIGPIASFVPKPTESNDDLAAQNPGWDMDVIFEKTGIHTRHIASPEQCASDLGVEAAERLFSQHNINRESVDFLLFCTQTPDYPLPTTACLVQQRLGLRTSIGALDYNLGCSGYVYGLSLADGLIRSEAAKRILLITSETYSKYIHSTDRSLRTIFGDGATATLIDASNQPSMGHFVFGTDGSGADTLMVADGGARTPELAMKPRKRKRWPSRLYMDGPELLQFALGAIPRAADEVLAKAGLGRDDVDFYLMHQATSHLLEHVRGRMNLEPDVLPIELAEHGNTVSNTLPILIESMRDRQRLTLGRQSVIVGFGVGLSWAACLWTETFNAAAKQAPPTFRRRAA